MGKILPHRRTVAPDALFGVHKEKPNRGSNNIAEASLLASNALTTEVATLKQDLKGSKKELGLAKRQLEENKGK